jgi:hypothetical protein
MIRSAIFVAIGPALIAVLSAAPAKAAARDRVFVASYGSDSNPCTFGSPCKTFQQAVNVVAPGGEVTAIDSAGFGPVTITQSVTITSPAGVEAGIAVASGSFGITVNTASSSDVVSLHGLTIDGAGSGQNGIVFNNIGSLEIIDVVVRNFTNDGIELIPLSNDDNYSNILISNVVASHNGNAGIYYSPQFQCFGMNAVIDHTVTTNNAFGMAFTSEDCANPTQRLNFTFLAISNSVASNNSNTGMLFSALGPSMIATIDTSDINNNQQVGISAAGLASVLLKHSVINSNRTGVDNEITSPGKFNTYGDNAINSNAPGGDVTNSLFSIPTK